jgi:phosphoribosylformimino-5-aminoimidazole carboxamide ribotide isomerase
VIVTSHVFRDMLDWERLNLLVNAVGKQRLVLDLTAASAFGLFRRDRSLAEVHDRDALCRNPVPARRVLRRILIHAADVEGLCRGIDAELVEKLGLWTPIPATYAGGARSLADLELVTRLGQGRIDLTIGSALDIFGGSGVRYADVVAFNRTPAVQ